LSQAVRGQIRTKPVGVPDRWTDRSRPCRTHRRNVLTRHREACHSSGMRIGVLGTTVASDSSGPVNLGGPKQRALLAALALHRGRAVSVDALADIVCNGTPPPGVSGTMQGYVAGLRRVLEPDRTTRGGGT